MSATLTTRQVMKLFNLENDCALFIPPYKGKFEQVRIGHYTQESVFRFYREREEKHRFTCRTQSLLMYVMDYSEDSQVLIAKKLGYKQAAKLHNFLEVTKASEEAEEINANLRLYYPELVKEFEEYMGK